MKVPLNFINFLNTFFECVPIPCFLNLQKIVLENSIHNFINETTHTIKYVLLFYFH